MYHGCILSNKFRNILVITSLNVFSVHLSTSLVDSNYKCIIIYTYNDTALVIYLIIRFIWDSFHSCVFIQLNIRLTINGVTFNWFFPFSLWFAFSCLWVYLVIFFFIGCQKIFLTLTCWMVAILYLCKYSWILFLAISYLEFFQKFKDLFFRSQKRGKVNDAEMKVKGGAVLGANF